MNFFCHSCEAVERELEEKNGYFLCVSCGEVIYKNEEELREDLMIMENGVCITEKIETKGDFNSDTR